MSYPIYNGLITALNEDGIDPGLMAEHQPIGQILEAIGEYEHGSVDIKDVFGDFPIDEDMKLFVYACVAKDICLLLAALS